MKLTFSSIISGLVLTVIVSSFFFPIGFRGLPESLNTKQMLGLLGVILFAFRGIREHAVSMRLQTIVSMLIAIVFSCWCYFSCIMNTSDDYTYAKYFLSFAVWIGGAYSIAEIIRFRHGHVDISVLTHYLAAVAVFQCIAAILVDNVPAFQSFVDYYFIQDTTPRDVNRMYGLGCSLDSGGVRFCIILVLMAYQMTHNRLLADNRKLMSLYIFLFLFITVVGCMIARTTMAGFALGMCMLLASYGINRIGTLSKRQVRFYSAFAVVTVIGVIISVYLYNHNALVRKDFRFAFEAFFNYVETGEFRTDSTDRLTNTMWIWPTDFRTWMIGDGLFEHFVHATDIGYCRFTFYCGIIGLSIFSLYFVYNASVVRKKFENATLLSYALLALTFIIWLKVSTDIFQIYALLFCIDADLLADEAEDEELQLED